MPADLAEGSLLLLDACIIINLLATGRFEEILRRLPYDFATSRLIARTEVLTLATGEPAASSEREIVPPARLEGSEDLDVLDLVGEEEMAQFVRFAVDLDDGEASVCALAVMREGAVATDDRKTLGLLGRMAPQVPAVQTPELLWEWARLSQAPEDMIGSTLRLVRDRARFRPRRNAPRYDWWESLLR